MMNTADRSLAMMDYALPRRFAFFGIEPGFNTKGFRKYQDYDDFSVNSYMIKIIKTTLELLLKAKISASRKKEIKKILWTFTT